MTDATDIIADVLVGLLDTLAEVVLRLTEMVRVAVQDAACPDTALCQTGLLTPEMFPYVVLTIIVVLLLLTPGGR